MSVSESADPILPALHISLCDMSSLMLRQGSPTEVRPRFVLPVLLLVIVVVRLSAMSAKAIGYPQLDGLAEAR